MIPALRGTGSEGPMMRRGLRLVPRASLQSAGEPLLSFSGGGLLVPCHEQRQPALLLDQVVEVDHPGDVEGDPLFRLGKAYRVRSRSG